MSTIRNYHDALPFYPASTRRSPFKHLLSTLRTVWDALGEGHAAARRYHQLTAQGLSHDQAASKVFTEHFATR